MSFTVQITATVASLSELTALFSGMGATTMTPAGAADHLAKVKAESKSIVTPIKTEPKPETAKEPTKAEAVGLTYPAIGEKIAKLVAKDRAAAVALLTKFGVKKGPELKEEQWPAFDAEVTAALSVEALA